MPHWVFGFALPDYILSRCGKPLGSSKNGRQSHFAVSAMRLSRQVLLDASTGGLLGGMNRHVAVFHTIKDWENLLDALGKILGQGLDL